MENSLVPELHLHNQWCSSQESALTSDEEAEEEAATSDKGKGEVKVTLDPNLEVTPPPPFNPVVKFFEELRRNYQVGRTDKLKGLQELARRPNESLWEV